MQNIKIYNAHCCGEIGDVIVESSVNLQGETILEQSQYLLENKKLRNFLLNEPRGGVFKHCNLIVSPKNKKWVKQLLNKRGVEATEIGKIVKR